MIHHRFHCQPDNIKSTHKINLENPLKNVQRQRTLPADQFSGLDNTGAVDRRIHLSKSFTGHKQNLPDIRLAGYVRSNKEGIGSDIRRKFSSLLFIDINNDDLGVCLDQRRHTSFSQTGGTPRNHCHNILNFHLSVPPSFFKKSK